MPPIVIPILDEDFARESDQSISEANASCVEWPLHAAKSLDERVAHLFVMCRCGHNRGEHLGDAPHGCEGEHERGDACVCKRFEAAPSRATPIGELVALTGGAIDATPLEELYEHELDANKGRT